MKKLIAAALIMLGLGLAGAIASFDWNDMRSFGTEPVFIEKSIDASQIHRITAQSSVMRIEVIPGEGEDIHVQIHGRASKKYLNSFRLAAEVKDDLVAIEGSYRESTFVGMNFVNVKMTIELPDQLWEEVKVQSNVGNITVHDLKAERAAVATDLGIVSLAGYELEQLSVRTTAGNIALKDGKGSVDAETLGGNIRLDTEEIIDDLILRTNLGNIRIDTAKEPQSAAITLQTDLGNRSVQWDGFQADIDSDRVLSGTIGDGLVKIDAKTNAGDIKLNVNGK